MVFAMQFLLRFALVIACGGSFQASGQSLRIEEIHEKSGNPTSKPEPRRVIKADPVSLYRRLVSDSEKDRKDAFRVLGHEEIEAREPVEARLYAVNLDSDADLEYILIASHGFPNRSIAIVLDKSGDDWRVVGDFSYWWHWDPNEAERFIELREIVWAGRKEIIVRDHGGGTGLAETSLSIYRMHDGYLYRVFRTTEDGFHAIVGEGTAEYEHRTIDYPEHAWNEPAYLAVHYRKRIEPAEKGQPVRKSSSCSVFRWDAPTFVFVKDKQAAPKFCSSTN
jgi:hypothetical protein